MKKIVLLVLLSAAGVQLFACDICGCGVGSYYMGLLPEFKKRFIGLRYQQKGLRSHLGPDNSSTYLTTDETYHTVELWGALNFGNKFRLVGFLPFNRIHRTNTGNTTTKQGLGDIAVTGYYRMADNKKTIGNKLLVQSLWIGGGLKIPTGPYNAEDKNIQEGSQNSFQLGTGSIDFSLNGTYDIRLQDAGINTNISYKMNLPNQYDYRYGNKFTLNMLGYYKFRIAGKLTITPNAGIQFETSRKDQKAKDIEVFESGGHSTMGTAGIEAALGKLSIGGNFQSPLAQQLGEGKLKAKERGMLYISYAF